MFIRSARGAAYRKKEKPYRIGIDDLHTTEIYNILKGLYKVRALYTVVN
jgi:hypothetical protein